VTRVEAADAAAAEALVLDQHPGARVHAVDATCRQIAVNLCRQVDLGRKRRFSKALRCSRFEESGRQDSNLRPSAPKALCRLSDLLDFTVTVMLLAVSVWSWRDGSGRFCPQFVRC